MSEPASPNEMRGSIGHEAEQVPSVALVTGPSLVPERDRTDLTDALHPVCRAWARAVRTVTTRSGWPESLVSTLLQISRHPDGVRTGVLAHELGLELSSMTRVLNRAEDAHLIERRCVRGDRRRRAVHLQPAGTALVAQYEASLARLRAEVLGHVPVMEVRAAARVLRAVETRIGMYLRAAEES